MSGRERDLFDTTGIHIAYLSHTVCFADLFELSLAKLDSSRHNVAPKAGTIQWCLLQVGHVFKPLQFNTVRRHLHSPVAKLSVEGL